MTYAHDLRTQLTSGGLVVAPGVYDGITARLAVQSGFTAVYMTGAGVSAARGFPDYGLLTLTEMAASAGEVAAAAGVPVIADADTGYGNELNATRTVREYEMRGVAALHIEDQVAPKRCGHLDGKEVISRAEFASKIAAAAAARRSSDLVVIARTDARAVAGLEEAVARVNLALAAGADVAFVEAPQTLEELAAVPRLVNGPCLLNIVPGGKTPAISIKDAREMGFLMVILPGLLLAAVVRACDDALGTLRDTGAPPSGEDAPSIRELVSAFWLGGVGRLAPQGATGS